MLEPNVEPIQGGNLPEAVLGATCTTLIHLALSPPFDEAWGRRLKQYTTTMALADADTDSDHDHESELDPADWARPSRHPHRECWVTAEEIVEATWRENDSPYVCPHCTARWIRVRERS